MIKKIFLTLFFLAGICTQVYGQDYEAKFKELADKGDSAEQLKLLQSWEKAKPDDPELYVSYFNYYFNESRKEGLSLTVEPKGDDPIVLKDTETGKRAGYLNDQIIFLEKEFNLALKYIDAGISKFPNRLDMRFGKIYALGQKGDFKSFTNEIVKVIDFSDINKNKWTLYKVKSLKEPKEFMLLAVQDYIVQLYKAGDENSDNIKLIAETVLKYYPESKENLSNLSIHYIIKENYDQALVYLHRAEKLAPTDFVILSNIAWSYYKKKDRTNAIKYYELVQKYGNVSAKNLATEKLKELRNNEN